METVFLSALTYIMLGLGSWAGLVSFGIFRNIRSSKKISKRKARSHDLFQLYSLIFVTIFTFIVTFIYPGLIHMIPSTIASFEIGSILVLIYLTEKHWKDWKNLQNTLSTHHLTN